MKKTITEADNEQGIWFAEAKQVKDTVKLVAFVNHLMDDYEHDYGTVCHAVAAAALAAAYTADAHPNGGITGFQARCVLWSFIDEWDGITKGQPKRLINYERMLYPQYAEMFEKIIAKSTWEHLQKMAKEKLSKAHSSPVHLEVVKHWMNIVEGIVPFGYSVVPFG